MGAQPVKYPPSQFCPSWIYAFVISKYTIYSSGHPSVYSDFQTDLKKFQKPKPQMLSPLSLQEWALNAAPTEPSYIDAASVRCELV